MIAAKFGFDIQDGISVGLDSRPATIRKAVEGSLKRLRTDYIDLLCQHRADPRVPVEAVAETVARLIEEGKVLHWGMREVSVRTIRKAHAIAPLTAIQNEYSVWYREAEQELIPALEEPGIGLVCFCPLGRGYLTGALDAGRKFDAADVRAEMPRFRVSGRKTAPTATNCGRRGGFYAACFRGVQTDRLFVSRSAALQKTACSRGKRQALRRASGKSGSGAGVSTCRPFRRRWQRQPWQRRLPDRACR